MSIFSPHRVSLKSKVSLSLLLIVVLPILLYLFMSILGIMEKVSDSALLFPKLIILASIMILGITTVFLLRSYILIPLHNLDKLVDQAYNQEKLIKPQITKDQDEISYLVQSFDILNRGLADRDSKIENRSRRLIALNAVSATISQTSDIDRMLKEVLSVILEVMEFDCGIAYLSDQDKGQLKARAWKGIQVEDIPELDCIDLGEGIVGKVAQEGQIAFIEDVSCDSRISRKVVRERGMKSMVAIPIISKERILGVLSIASFQPAVLTVEENEFLLAICQQVGIAIESVNLLNSWTKKAQELSYLLDVSTAVSSTLNLDKALNALAGKISQIADAVFCYIALLDEDREHLVLKAIHSGGSDDFRVQQGKKFDLRFLPLHRRTLESRNVVRIGADEIEGLKSEEKLLICLARIDNAVLLPLSISQRVLGLVCLGSYDEEKTEKLTVEKLNLCMSMASQAAIAIENAQLYEYVQERIKEITTIYKVGQSLITIVDLDKLLDRVLKVIVSSFGYLNCAIMLLDEDKNELYFKAARGYPEKVVKELRIKVGEEGVTGWVAKTGQPLVVQDVSKDPRFIRGRPDSKSEIAVPLKIGDRIIGVFDAESNELSAFSQKDLRVLSQLASQIAVSIENSRLFQQEKKRSLQLAMINDVGKRAVSTLNLDEIVNGVVSAIVANFGYSHVSLFLMCEDTGELMLKTHAGEFVDTVKEGYRLKVGVGMIGWSAKTGRALLSNDVSTDFRYVPAISEIKSELCVPIKTGEEILGVIDVESQKLNSFDQRDVVVLETLADFLAIALNNIRLYRETERKAQRLLLMDEINRAISSTLDLDSIFKVTAEKLKKVVSYERMNLAYWCPEVNSFELGAIYFSDGRSKLNIGTIVPAEDTQMSEVVKSKSSFVMNKLSLENSIKATSRMLYVEGVRSFVSIPVLSHADVIAVLTLTSRNHNGFDSQTVEMLKSVASHLSVAIKNARLFSDLQKAYDNLKRTQDQLVQSEKLRALGEMAGGVVHDFNNVLASVLGRTQLLLKRFEQGEAGSETKVIEGLKTIEKVATDGSKILSRIHEFTKMKPEKAFTSVSLNSIVEDALDLTRLYWESQALSRGVKIRVEKELSDISPVKGNPSQLREVLTNIIINCVDAMPQGGQIKVKTNQDDKISYVVVSDSGIGMSEEVKQKVFEPFFTTKGRQGTGLGMSVAYSIVTRHGGEILIDSELNKGSTFTVKLPKAVEKEVVTVELTHENTKKAIISAHVLVVDDEESLRDILEEMLLSGGYKVSQAGDGIEGLNLFKKEKIDILITDLGMPGMSGWELIDKVREIRSDIPIILTTGWGAQVSVRDIEKRGISTVIDKPFSLEGVLKAVSEALQRPRHLKKVRN